MNLSKYFLILVLSFSTSQSHAIVKQASGAALAYYGLKQAWSVLGNTGIDDDYIVGRQRIMNSTCAESEKQNALANYDLRVSVRNLSYGLIKLLGYVYMAKKGLDLTGLN